MDFVIARMVHRSQPNVLSLGYGKVRGNQLVRPMGLQTVECIYPNTLTVSLKSNHWQQVLHQ